MKLGYQKAKQLDDIFSRFDRKLERGR